MQITLCHYCAVVALLATTLTLAGQESEQHQLSAGQAPVAVAPPPTSQSPAASPSSQPLHWGPLSVSGSLRTRLEGWDWFDGNANDSYVFPHAILRFAIGQQRRTLNWQLEFAAPVLLGLPDHAVSAGAQGQMGLGGTYYVANGERRNAASIFPSKAYLRFKGLGGNDSSYFRIGRFEFVEGTEVVPKDATLAALKRMRINHRLIGSFPWPVSGRSQDGITLSLNPGRSNVTVVAARPTRGVFQADGLGQLDIALAYGAFTVPRGTAKNPGELRIFGMGYDDARAIVKTDNRSQAARSGADRFANLKIGTFGAHYLQVVSLPSGKFDLLLWGAGQAGRWGTQDHRAWVFASEVGWQPAMKLRPWLRLGYIHGSGDEDPTDDTHGTFFQMLPTPRWYARYPFYNFQNNEDYSASVIVRPNLKWNLRSEFHVLRLSSRNDLWYQGGGAFQPRTFGYIGRSSSGNRGLGNLWDVSADFTVSPRWELGLYFANVWGKGVIKSVYPQGENSRLGYMEITRKF